MAGYIHLRQLYGDRDTKKIKAFQNFNYTRQQPISETASSSQHYQNQLKAERALNTFIIQKLSYLLKIYLKFHNSFARNLESTTTKLIINNTRGHSGKQPILPQRSWNFEQMRLQSADITAGKQVKHKNTIFNPITVIQILNQGTDHNTFNKRSNFDNDQATTTSNWIVEN